MAGWAIVAIPDGGNKVWQASSEKIPHLTILYLGEQDNSPYTAAKAERISGFVQHAVNFSLPRFGLTVDRRGTLGPDSADVLFFDKNYPGFDTVASFRAHLLGNREIREAYDSVDQYPEWTPHLTLGYPDNPGEQGVDITYVGFDRVAIWFGEFEGPEYVLKDDTTPVEVMMSDEVGAFLAHYGVKGMRWGVRKDRSGGKESVDRSSKKGLSLSDPRVKRAAIAGAAVTTVVAAAYVTNKYGVKSSSINADVVKKGYEKTSEIIQQPTDIIYMSKPYKGSGVTRGGVEKTSFRFISEGKTKDYFKVFDDAGLNSDDFKPGDFKKLTNGAVAALFSDLTGRVDAALRPVPHAVLIPPNKAVGLNSVEDVINKFGPELERMYQEHLTQARRNST